MPEGIKAEINDSITACYINKFVNSTMHLAYMHRIFTRIQSGMLLWIFFK